MNAAYQEMYPLWPIDAMVPYVENELLWDPRQDVDAILAEYYRGFFGPAAAPMQGFYQMLEEGYRRWIEQEGLPHWYARDASSLNDGQQQAHFKVLSERDLEHAATCLQMAGESVAPGSREAQRIEVVAKVFRFIVPQCERSPHQRLSPFSCPKLAQRFGTPLSPKLCFHHRSAARRFTDSRAARETDFQGSAGFPTRGEGGAGTGGKPLARGPGLQLSASKL